MLASFGREGAVHKDGRKKKMVHLSFMFVFRFLACIRDIYREQYLSSQFDL